MGVLPGTRARLKPALFFVAFAAVLPLASGCGDKPVASVNGQKLTDREFYQLCETATEINPQRGTVGMQVLAQWIRNSLLAQEAKKQNVYPSDAELNARVDTYRKQAAFAGANFEDQLRQQGVSLESFKRQILNGMISENLVCKGVTVSDEEVRKEFEKQQKQMTQPEQIEISQITVDSEPKMKQVRSDLGANTQFALVASTHSKDPFAQQGGKVPFPLGAQGMPPGGPVDKKVIDAAFRLKEGQVGDPVKVGANWVFARLDKRIAEKKPNFDDVRDLMRSVMRQQKAQANGQAMEVQRALVATFQKANVEVTRPEYQVILNQIKLAAPGAGGAPSQPMAAEGHEGHDHGPAGGEAAPPPPPPGG